MNKQERNKKIIELYENGVSFSKIGDMFGISRQRIYQIINSLPRISITNKNRKAIYKKYNNKCFICGNKKSSNNKELHIHHIDGDPTNNRINNLILLCSVCHKSKHSNEEDMENKLLVARFRIKYGISQETIAKALNISSRHWVRIEKGEVDISLQHADVVWHLFVAKGMSKKISILDLFK